MQKTQRLDSLDLLRGIAVLMVCFCHFGAPLSNDNTYSAVFNAFYKYGRFGVQMFFVISGFVIPLSLYNGKFTFSNYFTFIHKRITRIHTPYIFALAVTLVIMFLSAYLVNRNIPENLFTIFQSVFYNHIPYNNPVFWTLIVEWQYYIFIGLFYCLLVKYPKLSVGIGIPVFVFIGQMGYFSFIHFFSFIVFFLIGNIGFLVYTKQGNCLLNSLMIAGLIIFSFCFYALTAALVSMVTILFILFYKRAISKHLLFIGKISFAVYLIHYPIGMKFLTLPYPILHQQPAFILFIFGLCMIILLSYFFYKWIEVPAEKLANKFKYNQRQKVLLGIHNWNPMTRPKKSLQVNR
ncbi:MAG: acyltransferase [Ginsengibacter sp.]